MGLPKPAIFVATLLLLCVAVGPARSQTTPVDQFATSCSLRANGDNGEWLFKGNLTLTKKSFTGGVTLTRKGIALKKGRFYRFSIPSNPKTIVCSLDGNGALKEVVLQSTNGLAQKEPQPDRSSGDVYRGTLTLTIYPDSAGAAKIYVKLTDAVFQPGPNRMPTAPLGFMTFSADFSSGVKFEHSR
jgi:hypothetical protein